jgi:hypothetical protein
MPAYREGEASSGAGRQAKDKRAIKRRRKMAAWDPTYLAGILGAPAR